MKTLIPIDRSTIRVNPHAGQSMFFTPGPTVVTEVKVYLSPKGWVREIWVGTGIEGGHLANGQLHDQRTSETAERPDEWIASLSCSQYFNQHHMISPLGRFLFEHQDIELSCEDCEAKFKYSELQSDSSFDDDLYCETICPRCGAWFCCEPVLERLSSAELEAVAGPAESSQP
jgi:hypothetical protein